MRIEINLILGRYRFMTLVKTVAWPGGRYVWISLIKGLLDPGYFIDNHHLIAGLILNKKLTIFIFPPHFSIYLDRVNILFVTLSYPYVLQNNDTNLIGRW